jgi:hypothetical protein
MRHSIILTVAATLGLAAATAAAQSPGDYIPVPITTSALMLDVVSPTTNPIWDKSYAPELTDADWDEVKKAASQLLTAATLVSLGGSDAAEKGWLDAPEWRQWSETMAATGMAALQAAEAQDQTALAAAGDSLVEDCMGCHVVFDPTAR